jgi:pimeloyl-ACP methyl ester carboxylesterase
MTKLQWTCLLLALFAFVVCPLPSCIAVDNADTKTSPALKVEVTGSGRPMILIPGLGCGGNVWDGTVAHFKNDFQCHVITLAGFAGQPAIGEPFLPQVRDALSDYIRDQKLDRPVIIGHSLGGFLAFWLGIERPEQVGPIIAVDGVPFYPALMDARATPESQQATAAMLRKGLSTQPPAFFAFNNQMTLATMITNARDVEMVAKLSNQSDPKAVGQALYEILTTDLREQVKSIRAPVLLIGATEPSASPEAKQKEEASYRAQVTAISQHQVVFAPNSRHFIQLDQPAFFFDAVENFLKETHP